MRSQEIGCVRVWCREDESAYLLHPDLWDAVKRAWMAGQAFFEGYDCYGELMVLKLSAVVVMSRATPEVMVEAAADAQRDREQEALGA